MEEDHKEEEVKGRAREPNAGGTRGADGSRAGAAAAAGIRILAARLRSAMVSRGGRVRSRIWDWPVFAFLLILSRTYGFGTGLSSLLFPSLLFSGDGGFLFALSLHVPYILELATSLREQLALESVPLIFSPDSNLTLRDHLSDPPLHAFHVGFFRNTHLSKVPKHTLVAAYIDLHLPLLERALELDGRDREAGQGRGARFGPNPKP